jgi:hypothetical protein
VIACECMPVHASACECMPVLWLGSDGSLIVARSAPPSQARADLAFVTTALKRDRKLKVRVLGCTVHTEAGPVALQRSKAVVAHLNTHGVLRQQCRAEACPPAMIHGLQEHGMSAVRFTVVQSLLFAKRLAFESGTAAVPSKAEPMLLKVIATMVAECL